MCSLQGLSGIRLTHTLSPATAGAAGPAGRGQTRMHLLWAGRGGRMEAGHAQDLFPTPQACWTQPLPGEGVNAEERDEATE